MEWFDCSIPLHLPCSLNSKEFNAIEDMFHIQLEDELFSERTHSSKCTLKSRFASNLTGKQKDVQWNS
jgi:hypothetical protein